MLVVADGVLDEGEVHVRYFENVLMKVPFENALSGSLRDDSTSCLEVRFPR